MNTAYKRKKAVTLDKIKQKLLQSEHDEQAALFEWAGLMQGKYPELSLLAAIPNGGKRDAKTGAMLKAEGVKKGFPDIILPVARGAYHGLLIELKAGRNKPTEYQAWWLVQLREQGYSAGVCYGFEEARDVILDYLRGAKHETYQQDLCEYIAQKQCTKSNITD